MTDNALKAIEYTVKDVDTTVRTAWAESRGEKLVCQIGVIWAIRNRVEMPGWWGGTPKEVCQKPWQFSCWNINDPNLPKLRALTTDDPEYFHFQQLVLNVFQGSISDPTRGCTTYKRTGTAASWDWVVDKTPPIVLGHQSFWRMSPDGRIIPLRPPAVGIPPAFPAAPPLQPIEALMLSKLDGYKTYIVAGASVIFDLVQFWDGQMDAQTLAMAVFAALGLSAARHGMTTGK